MPGIIHLQHDSRLNTGLTRRSLMLGAVGLAAACAFDEAGAVQGTPDATPAEPLGSAEERLTALLRLVPASAMGGPDPDQWLFTWVDLEAQFSALGITDWDAPDVNLVEATMPLAFPDNLSRYAADEEVREVFGFSPFDAHQILVAGNAPDAVTYYAGGVPVGQLPAVWEAAGYERKTGEHGDYWTVGEEGEIELSSPITRYGMGSLNNVAILNDEVIVFTGTAELLQEVQGLMDGGDSAADDPEILELIGTLLPNTANLIVMPGNALAVGSITPEGGTVTGADLLAESDAAVGPMPQVSLAGFGITAGAVASGADGESTPMVVGNTAGLVISRLLTASPEDARAAAEVVAWRIENMASPVSPTPYSDLLVPESAGLSWVAGNTAAVNFRPIGGAGVWYQMLYILDLWPFAWIDA